MLLVQCIYVANEAMALGAAVAGKGYRMDFHDFGQIEVPWICMCLVTNVDPGEEGELEPRWRELSRDHSQRSGMRSEFGNGANSQPPPTYHAATILQQQPEHLQREHPTTMYCSGN